MTPSIGRFRIGFYKDHHLTIGRVFFLTIPTLVRYLTRIGHIVIVLKKRNYKKEGCRVVWQQYMFRYIRFKRTCIYSRVNQTCLFNNSIHNLAWFKLCTPYTDRNGVLFYAVFHVFWGEQFREKQRTIILSQDFHLMVSNVNANWLPI